MLQKRLLTWAIFAECMLATGVYATTTQVDGFTMDNGIYEVGENDWQK
jgi:hypothetical protein